MGADIVPFERIQQRRRGFDPDAADAEARYDRVVQRYNLLAARRLECRRTIDEIERQFVEDDLTTKRGVLRGAPLGSEGRRRRLWHFVCLNRQVDAIDSECARLHSELDVMNDALEAWAREAYAADRLLTPAGAPGDGPAPASGH